MLAAGANAPKFQLSSPEGTEHSLDSLLAGGPVLLAFFKVSCPTCQLTFPYLDRLRAPGSKLRIFGVSQNDAPTTEAFRRRFGLTMPLLLDSETQRYPASNAYGLTHVPSMFLVETDGTISFASTGFLKQDIEEMGRRAGVTVVTPADNVPDWRPG